MVVELIRDFYFYSFSTSVRFDYFRWLMIYHFPVFISSRIPSQHWSWETHYILFLAVFIGTNTHQNNNIPESYLLFSRQFSFSANSIKLQNCATESGAYSRVTWKILPAYHHELQDCFRYTAAVCKNGCNDKTKYCGFKIKKKV